MPSSKICDERERSVILIAPCIINPAFVACGFYNKNGFETRMNFLSELLHVCLENLTGILPYTCPEYAIMGLPRPNASKGFYLKHRDAIKKIAEDTVRMIRRCRESGINVIALIGVEGSPCCGVTWTKCGAVWNEDDLERFKKEYRVGKDLTEEWYRPTHRCRGKGVFIEVLDEYLGKEMVNIPVFGFSAENYEEIIGRIKALFKESAD